MVFIKSVWHDKVMLVFLFHGHGNTQVDCVEYGLMFEEMPSVVPTKYCTNAL